MVIVAVKVFISFFLFFRIIIKTIAMESEDPELKQLTNSSYGAYAAYTGDCYLQLFHY